MNVDPGKRRGRRTGAVLHEALMAIALAVAVLAGVAQLLALVAQQRRLGEQRTVAVREASNLMEDYVSRAWDEITGEKLAKADVSEVCRRCLPEAQLHVEVSPEADDSRRISIQISWRATAGRPGEPVRLVGWKFRDEETQP
jgi:hypothetical protein